MEKLPDELISIILKDYLDIAEIVKCRLISKRFRFVIDNYVSVFLSKLIVNDDCAGIYSLYYVHQWSYEWTGRSLNGFSICLTESFELFRAPLFQNLFSNLRYLICYLFEEDDYEKLEYLNEFVKLEKLSLALDCMPRCCQTLTLPNLKCFGCSFENYLLTFEDQIKLPNWEFRGHTMQLSMRTPEPARKPAKKPDCYLKLNSNEKLWLTNFREVRLCRPEQVTCLDVRLLDAKNLSEFKSLRTLKCQAISNSNLDLLECLPSLKEIYVESSRKNYFETKVLLDHLIQQKATLNKNDVQIYFCDILLTRPFESYGFEQFFISIHSGVEPKKETEMRLHNYDRLADRVVGSCNHHGIYYSRVIDCLDKRAISLASFFKKFPNILHLIVNEINSEANFLSFLKQCSYLIKLDFIDSPITQLIIDQLPYCCPHLRKLVVGSADVKLLDCRPLLKLNHVRNHHRYKKLPKNSEKMSWFILRMLI